jgi:hypothetical protein
MDRDGTTGALELDNRKERTDTMNRRRPSSLVIAIIALAGAATVFGSGCIAEPGDERTAHSDEALINKNPLPSPDSPATYTCTYEAWDTTSTFEHALRDLGCASKALLQGNGDGTGWFSSGCAYATTTATEWCPLSGQWETLTAARLAQCYASVPPIYSFTNPAGGGNCTPGRTIVAWDPTCGGSACRIVY